jgi:hypothetical protein
VRTLFCAATPLPRKKGDNSLTSRNKMWIGCLLIALHGQLIVGFIDGHEESQLFGMSAKMRARSHWLGCSP